MSKDVKERLNWMQDFNRDLALVLGDFFTMTLGDRIVEIAQELEPMKTRALLERLDDEDDALEIFRAYVLEEFEPKEFLSRLLAQAS